MAVADVAGYTIAKFAKGSVAPKGQYAHECAQTVTAIAGAEVVADLVNCINWHKSGQQLTIQIFNTSGEALTDFRVDQYVESTLATAATLTTDVINITEKFTNYPDATDPATLAGGANVVLSHGRGDLPDGFKLVFKATTAATVTYIVRMA